jgi:ribosomal peptide maturation radical SAM protein 1
LGSLPLRGNVEALDSATRERRARFEVGIVSMPFVSARRPSLQVGLLVALARSHGFAASGFHLNLDFARRVGQKTYESLCQHRGLLVGEWLFSVAAFGGTAPDPEHRFLELLDGETRQKVTRARLLEIRNELVPAYIDELLETVPWRKFRVIGFSSTFQQNTPSFALARRLKERHPDLTIVFGGSNFEGEMGAELTRSVDCIDFAVAGEGDRALPALLVALTEGRDPSEIPNLLFRSDGHVRAARGAPRIESLDELPVPDYGDYFERAEKLGLLAPTPRRDVDLPFESARGCWWGQKHHCTFCGLNGETMAFRSKSPKVVLAELGALASRYRSFRFEAVDNIIDHTYFRTLLPELERSGVDYDLFYELKSNLTRDDLRLLFRAGVRRVQPGIESLSTNVLRLMRKGVSALQNINTLRWARYYGISMSWNLLWGFPGETLADYQHELGLMRHLLHLTPPVGWGRVWLERFSPLFSDRQAFPAEFIRPTPSYAFVYPTRVELDKIAYFFDHSLEGTLPDEAHKPTADFLFTWKSAWSSSRPPTLTYRSSYDFVQIEDSRRASSSGTYTFEGALARLYQAASDRPISTKRLAERLAIDASDERITEALDAFCESGLMARDGDQFLALALPATTER